MDIMHCGANRLAKRARAARGCRGIVALLLGLLGGCASMTNPVADGVPVHRLPNEVLAPRKDELTEIPLSYLRQPPPERYELDSGDVLGVFIEGVLGEKNQAPPVRFFTDTEAGNQSYRIPAMGYPIVVGSNGTVPLPLIAPLDVRGKTIEQARSGSQGIHGGQPDPPPGRERILVNLMQPRTITSWSSARTAARISKGKGRTPTSASATAPPSRSYPAPRTAAAASPSSFPPTRTTSSRL